MIKRALAAAAVVAIPAFTAVAFMSSPAAATSPVAPVKPGEYCAVDAHFTVRPGPSDRVYQCQNHGGWRWVPTEPCPTPNDHRLVAICYPIVYPSASPSAPTRLPCASSTPTSRPTLPPICPSNSPSKVPSASPTASASGGVVAIPSDNGVGDKLPVTGSKAGKIAALGGAAAVFGAVLAWIACRRRTRFTTED